ncbi:hypothetical protein OPKNFCMD_6460 [Methylobacterium crusticola]|uniref:Metallo-beta-lactamase domain-containing protein n=1 Tax=Methylobacterium crusticola TaxID=1697972 RepID=A0ABQ4R7L2_9HYPH|nr:MBL fold metallo-hydrolase [Methylobacterium crusticola]GJD53683.1 hypothetical protein OPKNFCMD_6460 [Methylobacterium crusticola]
MASFICTACGTAFPEAATPPDACLLCSDERQFVPASGQSWTVPERLAAGHANAWRQHEPGLLSLRTRPAFAIDQRAFLVRTPSGNVLWDCLALLDDATEAIIRGLGGLAAIAISHPHYYTRMGDWARTFGAPIHLHAADRAWIVRPDPAIRLFEDETAEILPGATVIRLGGHFPGGTVLHWAAGAGGAGVLLSGDIVQVAADTRRVSFLWSYPNMMPLPAATVRRIARTLEPWAFARLYGAFDGKDVRADAKGVVARSAERYAALLEAGEA